MSVGHAQDPFVEIDFEPIVSEYTSDARPATPVNALRKSAVDSRAGAKGHATTEDEFDRAIQGMLGGMLGALPSNIKQKDMEPSSAGTTAWRSPDGRQQIMIQEIPMQRSSMPVDMFRDLFPGPLLMEDGGSGATPFADPDPMVMDMMQELNNAFSGILLPIANSVRSGSRAPRSCQADVMKHCSKQRSQVHCLGQHQDDISEACRKDVGKSVPFLCSRAIDRFCDVLQRGILQCLGEHLKDLDGQCSDAVIATHHVIAKANNQKASVKVTNPATGEKTVHTVLGAVSLPAKPASSPKDREALLDAQLWTVAGRSTNTPVAALSKKAEQVASSLPTRNPDTAVQSPGVVWKVLILGALVVVAYVFALKDSSTKAYSVFKPYMRTEESLQPLRGGVELPKAV